jgi:hypothetical protein
LKASTPHGEFEAKVAHVLLMNKFASTRLITLARHLTLLEEKSPYVQALDDADISLILYNYQYLE